MTAKQLSFKITDIHNSRALTVTRRAGTKMLKPKKMAVKGLKVQYRQNWKTNSYTSIPV